jgi:transcriptional antiterminator Rof (Rho-off)
MGKTTVLNWKGKAALKCRYRISIRVKIEGWQGLRWKRTNTQQRMYFRQNLQGVKEEIAVNDEIDEALSLNREGKEKS